MARIILLAAALMFLGDAASAQTAAAANGAGLRGAALPSFQQVVRKRGPAARMTSARAKRYRGEFRPIAPRVPPGSTRATAAPQPRIIGPVPGIGTPINPVPPLAIPPGSTFHDRVLLCTHHAGSFGVAPDQMGVYLHNCAM